MQNEGCRKYLDIQSVIGRIGLLSTFEFQYTRELPKRPHRGHNTVNKRVAYNVNTQEKIHPQCGKRPTTRDEKERNNEVQKSY